MFSHSCFLSWYQLPIQNKLPLPPTSIAMASSSELTTDVAPAAPSSAQTVAIHLLVTLNLQDSNYTMWSTFFLALCGKFNLLPHVQSAVPTAGDPNWVQDDYTVKTWMYGSISTDLLAIVMEPNQSAYALWTRVESQFRDNKEARAVFLQTEFHSLLQGSMSVSDYCQKIKTLTDSLRDVGYPVSDPTLVINTLRGLNPRFSSAATHISLMVPLPTFTNVRSMLLMQEMRLENESRIASATALFANYQRGASASCGHGQCQKSPSSSSTSGSGTGKKGKNKRGKGSYGGSAPPRQHTPPSSTSASTGPWVCFSPGAGILGTRPPGAQALTMTAPSTMSSTPSSAATWDQAALIAAMNNLSTQEGWIMDSGASTHMTSDDGNLHPSFSLSRHCRQWHNHLCPCSR